jgi:hypothetical protein
VAPQVYRRVLGSQDIQPQDELLRDFGDEHPNLQSVPPLIWFYQRLHQEGDGLPRRHLQNVWATRLPLDLSCDDAGLAMIDVYTACLFPDPSHGSQAVIGPLE